MAARTEVTEYPVKTFSRDVFLKDVWDYGLGEHVTILGATRNGKTHLAYQLLHETATPDLQATVIVMKPRDETVTRFSKANNFRIIRDWPPSTLSTKLTKKPAGYVLWPQRARGEDPNAADERHARIFMRCLRSNYDKGHTITFADELYSLENEYNMPTKGITISKDLIRMWSKGGSMHSGLWTATQRPAYVSKYAYQAQHIFLSNDPDKETLKRYGDIGAGIDSDVIRALTMKLKMYQWVYINRDQRAICIVDK